ncbi:MAG: hypothetical protein RLZZ345_265 [Actinomycetota bacterium]
MRIVFAGTTDNAVEVLRYLIKDANCEVVGVLTREDAPVGRSKQLTPSPVAEFASNTGLPVIRSNRIDGDVNNQISMLNADLGVVVAYGALLKRETLDLPKKGWINIHYSLLPELRGAAPVQHALMNCQSETGITIFQLDEGMDTGPIHAQLKTRIESTEAAGELLSRLTRLAITMIDEVLAKISAGFEQPEQQVGRPSFAPKLTRPLARIDFEKSAIELEGLVRGCNPEPMAWAELHGEPLRVLRARALDRLQLETPGLAPGTVAKLGERIVVVAAKETLLELLEVQPASKRIMSAADWHRGQSGSVKLD